MVTKQQIEEIFLAGFRVSGSGLNGFHVENMTDRKLKKYLKEDIQNIAVKITAKQKSIKN